MAGRQTHASQTVRALTIAATALPAVKLIYRAHLLVGVSYHTLHALHGDNKTALPK